MATDTFLIDCMMLINSSNFTKGNIQSPHIAQYIRPVLSQIARFIPSTLSRLIKSGKVRFSPLKQGLFGYHNELSSDIVVEKSFRDKKDTVGAAIVLFHETAHSIVKDEAFDEEIVSHYLESAFYMSLQLNKGLKNSNKIKDQEFRSSMEKLYMAIHNGKIVEYLLQYDMYQKCLTDLQQFDF